jgi:hypothetical protein
VKGSKPDPGRKRLEWLLTLTDIGAKVGPLTRKAAAAARVRATRSGDVTSVTITPVKQRTVSSQPATPAGVASTVSASSAPTK